MFIEKLWENPTHYISWVTIVVFSVCIHELSHVYMALSQGDDTAAKQGYVTLDPLRLMGRQSLIALAFIGIAWGAVPVTLSKFRHRYSHALVSAAGPGSNFVLAMAFAAATILTIRLAPSPETALAFSSFFHRGVQVNCALGILNVLPIPMFDGWEIAALFAPRLNHIPREKRYYGGWIALMILFMTPASEVLWRGAFALSDTMVLRAARLLLPAAS